MKLCFDFDKKKIERNCGKYQIIKCKNSNDRLDMRIMSLSNK